jgi:hypothetical protein
MKFEKPYKYSKARLAILTIQTSLDSLDDISGVVEALIFRQVPKQSHLTLLTSSPSLKGNAVAVSTTRGGIADVLEKRSKVSKPSHLSLTPPPPDSPLCGDTAVTPPVKRKTRSKNNSLSE